MQTSPASDIVEAYAIERDSRPVRWRVPMPSKFFVRGIHVPGTADATPPTLLPVLRVEPAA